MALAVANGARVTCVTATAGEAGETGVESVGDAGVGGAGLGSRRIGELRAALGHLGVDDLVLLGEPDGGCADRAPDGPVDAIAGILVARRPDTVVTFGPDGLTGHPDHRAVSRWVDGAVDRAADSSGPRPRVLHTAVTAAIAATGADVDERFGVYDPGLPTIHDGRDIAVHLDLDGPWLHRKIEALRAHHSQTAPLIEALGAARYRDWVRVECFVDAPRPGADR